MRLAVLASSLFILACTAPTSSPGSATQAIVDGERTNNDENAVVAVLNRFGGLCTGTLIAPRLVLTAKHCVQNPGASEPNAPSAFIIGVGDNINRLSSTYSASEVTTTPGVYTDRGGLGGALVGIDIALIVLSRDPGIDPYPVWREGSATDLVGETVRAVGFGQTPGGGAGVKYHTTTRLDCIGCYGNSNVIYTGPTICQGDSGGPLLTLDNQVIGVSSFGSGGCGTGINGFNRVDTFMEMIDAALDEVGACRDDGVEVCDGADNDCDGEVDEDCALVGEPCADDSECVTLTCRDVDGSSICTQGCDPLRPATGCPPDFYCQSMGASCEGVCAPGTAGALPNDAECSADSDCASQFCSDPGDGRRRCLTPCRGDAGTCVSGDVCAAGAGACGGCVPAGLVSALRGLGEACAEDADCASGSCLDDGGEPYCTRACAMDTECAEGFHCRVEADGGVCIRGVRGGVGTGCVANADCADGLFCANRGDVSWCTSFCDADPDCPPMFSCTDVGGGNLVCVPDTGVQGDSCAVPEDCISGFCQAIGTDGESVCTRLCSAESGCDTGFACTRTSDGINNVCVPDEPLSAPTGGGGGCSAGGSGSGAMLLLLALLLVRRRGSEEA